MLAIRRIPDSGVVAVCDSEPRMARQLAERFEIKHWFSDVRELMRAVIPEVVHLTTPPQSHLELATICLEAGSNVYVEKPFTVTAQEARLLLELAEQRGLKITVGHNYQFTNEMLEMRRLIAGGFLGGPPVHLESYWSYNLSDVSYGGPVLANANHWVRKLPGQLFQNIISHGIARLAEFLDDEIPELTASAHQSPRLQALGERYLLDELRVMLRDRNGTTGTFCFTTQVKPSLNGLRVYGPANSLDVDVSRGCLTKRFGRSYKSYLTYLIPSWKESRAHASSATRNAVGILRGQLHLDFGLKTLIEQFHASVQSGGQLPISYREILLTTRIMDDIFARMTRSAGSGCVG